MSESAKGSSSHSSKPLGTGMGGVGHRGLPKVRPKNTLATLKKLWSYLKRQRTGLIIVYIFTFLSSVISLIGPFLIGKAIDDFIIPKDYNGLLWICLLMLGIYILGSVVTWVQSYVMSGVSQRTVLELRHDLFDKYQSLPLKFFDTHNTGELMSRTTNDIENVSNSLNQSVIQLLTSLITLSGSLVIMLSLNLSLTLVSLITIPLILLATRQISSLTRKYFKGQQKHLGELNGFIEETIQGQKVVTLYRREATEIKRFKTINSQLNAMGTKAQIVAGLVGPVMNAVNNFNFALIAAIGGWMVFKDLTTVGIIVSFLNYSKQFGRPITELANQYNMIQSAVAGAERVFEIMELDSEYTEDQGVATSHDMRGKVQFDNVSFSYRPDAPILQNVSFVANPGEKIALVGPTGAGKTTIVNLLTRFYDINEGRITIDESDIRQMDKNNLRTEVGMVLQDAYVFSGSIRDNIRFGRLDATDEEIIVAAKLANADSFISRLPHGYDMILQAEGSNLSHGQRQLLTIARAILANPSILILDEATSSVDTRTEMHIQEAMKNLMKGRTSFVIAHRLSTIQDADKILVMNGGQIIEQGNHEQLLAAKGFYYELYSSQFRRVV
ncbi:ABC transporter ATP-binding protein [Paenibacillus glacialis]|uniref:Multidrug ABC transporter ATP-binding protein n=1 Tax=Paenibacillus glacialis TaxID=494026 RepID=A0A168L2S3_9BACL|nr:ABC transporter ATP-binding protein [Paenibacillus glacialis]OAB42820.1 multidrug ABC transporter ATP-binding protein [Paenibacillus glacialis]